MKKVRIAQIGTSNYSHGRSIFNSLLKQTDLYDVAGYVFPENEGEKFSDVNEVYKNSKELTLEEVLNDPTIEAVTIETEEKYLTKYATLAAKAGKHIHMEKPGGYDLNAFEEFIEEMKKSGKVFHTGYMYRYNPEVKKLLKAIEAGELGDIISVDAQMSGKHPDEQREWLKEIPGGMMFFLGCHLIDLVLKIKGTPKRIVPFIKNSGVNGIDAPDVTMTVFEYDNGFAFVKTNDIELGGFARRNLVVVGSKKTVEIRPLEILCPTGQKTTTTTFSSEDWWDNGNEITTEIFDRYDSMVGNFAKIIRGEGENPATLDYELELYKTVMKAIGR
ncbi:MAG: Gfo/Idh/MocA family oxidoreductase [Ruminococcaceae bacterium]|nr:Gfo/Idh/MocA family oxidoreductase [Oscillospiraceae bacterium]